MPRNLHHALLAAFTLLLSTQACAGKITPTEIVTYKEVDGDALKAHIFKPEGWKASDRRTAIVCYFGGGWVKGTPGHFYRQADYFAKRGVVALSMQYRWAMKDGRTVNDCVADGQDALRWVTEHASELGVDPDKIVVMGGSAGGHVAACTLMVNDPRTGKPSGLHAAAMVLYNPVADAVQFTEKRLQFREGIDIQAISPIHHLSADVPPTQVHHGNADPVVPYATAKAFVTGLQSLGVDAELVTYEGCSHGFFNLKKGQEQHHRRSIAEADRFLVAHGLLAPQTGETD